MQQMQQLVLALVVFLFAGCGERSVTPPAESDTQSDLGQSSENLSEASAEDELVEEDNNFVDPSDAGDDVVGEEEDPAEDGDSADDDKEKVEIGSSCTASSCGEEAVCIPEQTVEGPTGFLDGYCVQFDCSLDSLCPDGSECFKVGKNDAGEDVMTCLDSCEATSDCRSGYQCIDPGACLPGCGEDSCPEGYDCAQDGICVSPDEPEEDPEEDEDDEDGSDGGDGEDDGDTDDGDSDDGEGAPDSDEGDGSPGDGNDTEEPSDGSDDGGGDDSPLENEGNVGAPCTANNDCKTDEAVCIPELDGDGEPTGFVGGFCIRLGCSAQIHCPNGSECYQLSPNVTGCLPVCSQTSDCREGYLCLQEGACVPNQQ